MIEVLEIAEVTDNVPMSAGDMMLAGRGRTHYIATIILDGEKRRLRITPEVYTEAVWWNAPQAVVRYYSSLNANERELQLMRA